MRPTRRSVPAAAVLCLLAGCSGDPEPAKTPPATNQPQPQPTGLRVAPEPKREQPPVTEQLLQATRDVPAETMGRLRADAGVPVAAAGAAGPATPGPAGPATPGPAGPTGGPVTGGEMLLTLRGAAGGRKAGDEAGTESYAGIADAGFLLVAASPLSTFAADVDTAAYSNLRRFLSTGNLPPKDAIRVEEIVNAQDYRDPPPDGREPFAITTELGACPWQREHQLLRIGLKTRPIETSKVPPCNLVFLIDVSGSMNHPQKLPLVVRAMSLLVEQLRPQDRIAIVTYAAGVHEPLPATNGADQQRILEVLTNLRAGGSTNGQGGIQRAYELAQQNLIPAGVNRVLLATDGDFNVGIQDADALEQFIGERKDQGVFLTVLGVGTGNLKDDRLERLANRGNGVYAYLDTLAEARRVLVEQFGASMMTVAKDVKLQLEFDPAQVAAWRQIGYENRQLTAQEFRDDQKDAGELGAGHTLTALYELVPPAVPPPAGAPIATLRIRYKPPLGNEARERSQPVDGAPAATPSRDFRVAAAAAALGMLLRQSQHLGAFGWQELQALVADPALDAAGLAGTIASAQQLAR